MDPLSIAGLGLGAASLAFQLFAGCIKGFVLLSTAHNLGKDGATLLCMLNLQEIRLTHWARRAGLLSVSHELDKRLNAVVVQAVLKELENLLLNTEKLKSRYKLGLKAVSISTPSTSRAELPPVGGVLDVAISDETRREIMFKAGLFQDRNDFPGRLRWAAVDKSRFEEYVGQIRLFVHELWALLDPLRQDELASGIQMVLSHVIGTSRQIEGLNALKETLQHSSVAPTNDDSSLASAAEIKAIGMSASTMAVFSPSEPSSNPSRVTSHENSSSSTPHSTSSTVPTSSRTAIHLESTKIQDCMAIQGNPDINLARYDREMVLIEWKELPVHSRSKIMARVQDLAILLSARKHPTFRSLRCKGIAPDGGAPRIAFVFELPDSIISFQPPRPLRTQLRGNPSVTRRLQLALRITQSVRYFHMAGWLHKNLQSSNVLILEPGDGLPVCPEHQGLEPILAGFAFSRLDSASEISEQPSADPQRDIYRHPEAMGEPSESFTAAKDVYALGTILLEIGEWRSLKSLVEKIVNVGKPEVPLIQLAKIRPFLLEEGAKGGLATLRFRMGDVYASVTKMMLSGKIPERFAPAKDSGPIVTPNLLDVAVRELGRCII
ncbi:MAG: hypothetical protein LQ338_006809 [Usnochroma carphineum]|nr:MAG: hypothetical protein LQ338_006809 [Usnochroma carphineum]